MKHLLCRVLLVVSVFPTITFGQSNLESQVKRVEQGLLPAVLIKGDLAWSLTDRMKHYKVPGLSVAVIKDFRIHWARSYGVKDLETNEPVTTDTIFQAGSISKSVAAMVAMKKVEQGKISLDENINNKLTSWKLPDNAFTEKKKVTLRNLLSHTAGTTVHGFPGYAVSEKVPSLQQVLDGAPPANTAAVRVDFEPGTRFRYSGGGTTVAQLAIMDIEKKSYAEIARHSVFAPLGMTNSTYSQPLPNDWRKKAATGYQSNGREVEGKIHVYPEMAAAGLWTTPTDLAKFAIEVQLSLVGQSNKILTKESVDTMTKSFIDNVGLGFFIEKHGAARYFGHGGADQGFRAELLVNREKGYGAVVMVNSDNGQIIREVIRGLAAEYGWDEFLPMPYELISLNSAKLENLSGRFQINPDRVLTITVEPAATTGSTRLFAQPTGDLKFELLPISATTFIRRDANVKYEFLSNVHSITATAESAGEGAGSGDVSGAMAVIGSIQIVTDRGTSEARRVSADTLVPYELLLLGKISEALEGYRVIKKEKPENASVTEDQLNNLGYTLMREKKLPEAIALFKLNTEFYPNAWNTYDSLGEAYMTNGDKDLAIANYKKSLALNPQNSNGTAMLKKLQGN